MQLVTPEDNRPWINLTPNNGPAGGTTDVRIHDERAAGDYQGRVTVSAGAVTVIVRVRWSVEP